MNTKTSIASFLATIALLLTSCGGDSAQEASHSESSTQGESDPHQEHDSFAKEPGPHGGRLITSITPNAEFFLRPDNHAQLVFLDDERKPLPIDSQSAGIVTGDRMNPFIVELVIDGDALVSELPLPEIEGQPLALRIQTSPQVDPIVERFNLKTYECAECDLAEYACICGH